MTTLPLIIGKELMQKQAILGSALKIVLPIAALGGGLAYINGRIVAAKKKPPELYKMRPPLWNAQAHLWKSNLLPY